MIRAHFKSDMAWLLSHDELRAHHQWRAPRFGSAMALAQRRVETAALRQF
jgi:hypothetical protein